MLFHSLGVLTPPPLEQLVDGYIQYRYENTTMKLTETRVDDGLWHNVEVKWMSREVWINLDYGNYEITHSVDSWVAGLYIGKISVGGVQPSDPAKVTGFKGCIKVSGKETEGRRGISDILIDKVSNEL